MSVESEVQKVATALAKAPWALKATQLFLEKVLAGENIQSALLKTAEILALEEALG